MKSGRHTDKNGIRGFVNRDVNLLSSSRRILPRTVRRCFSLSLEQQVLLPLKPQEGTIRPPVSIFAVVRTHPIFKNDPICCKRVVAGYNDAGSTIGGGPSKNGSSVDRRRRRTRWWTGVAAPAPALGGGRRGHAGPPERASAPVAGAPVPRGVGVHHDVVVRVQPGIAGGHFGVRPQHRH
jgi:hypothetical protein